uniref:Uncharacterized protein n=1 Tax=Tetraselmis sp. GSL018 TaxID=582737 RepID=A0A061SEF8_9CHLO
MHSPARCWRSLLEAATNSNGSADWAATAAAARRTLGVNFTSLKPAVRS